MTNSEVQYGVLLACCAVVETGIAFCILQELQPQKDIGGMPITSEFNCPLLLLTSNVYAIPTTSIISPVSVIHCVITLVLLHLKVLAGLLKDKLLLLIN